MTRKRRRSDESTSRPPDAERVARYKSGLRAEWRVAVWLMLRGHRILALRYKTPVGEIDLIAKRGQRLAIVEVKRRKTLDAALLSITPQLQRRVQNAAALWHRRQAPNFSGTIAYDVVALVPSPRSGLLKTHYLKDAFDHRKTL